MSRSKSLALVILIVLAIGLTPWPVKGITPQDQTISIIDTHDDAFITESGILIDTSLVTILDPGMDIRSFLVFNDVEINFWEPLENATLRLRSSNTLSFDADSSITIYGMKWNEVQDLRPIITSDIMAMPLTTAHVNYNTSQFYGQVWHDVNVTDIVEELIRAHHWDGDGTSGTETGDSIGFIIFGAGGHDTRYFYDYAGNPSLSADLVIHWNHEPSPPSGVNNPVFNETYRGYHIWWTQGSNYTIHTIDYSEWPYIRQVGGHIYPYNTTGITIDGVDCSSDKFRKVNASTNSPFGLTGTLLLMVNISEGVNNYGGADLNRLNMAYLSFCNYNGSMVDNHGGAGREHTSMVLRHNADNSTNDIFRYATFTDSALGASTGSSQHFHMNDTPHYLNVTWDFPNQYMATYIYADPERTILLDTVTRGPGYGGIEATGYNYHMVMNTYTLGPGWFGTFQNVTLVSDTMNATITTTWIVTDENGTTIVTGLDDYDDVIDFIENLLGADPEDPDPPADDWPDEGPFTRFKTRGYFFILGFFLVWGPIWFMAWKRPSGYYILAGLLVMLIGIGLLIHVGSI